MHVFTFKMICLIFCLLLSSCASMTEVKNDNTREILQSKQAEVVDNELSKLPAIISIPVAQSLRPPDVKNCPIDIPIFLEIVNTDFVSILDTIAMNKNINFAYSIDPKDPKENIKMSLKYKGNVAGLLDIMSQKTGFFFTCNDNTTVVLEKQKVFSVPVPNYAELLKYIKENLEKLGATQIGYENLTTTLSFTSNYHNYSNIKNFLTSLSQNATLVNLKIVLLGVNFKKDQNIGVDWTRLLASRNMNNNNNNAVPPGGALPAPAAAGGGNNLWQWSFTGTTTGASVLLNKNEFSFTGLFNFLETYGKYSILQNVFLQTVSGVKGKIQVTKEIPYIKDVSISASTAGNNNTPLGTATSEKAKSGVEMEITPYYDKFSNMLSININVNVSEVLRLVNLNAGQQIGTLTQPETTTRAVNTYIRMTPEQVVILGGLLYEKDTNNLDGIAHIDTYLTKTLGTNKITEELVILVKPTIIEFVSQK